MKLLCIALLSCTTALAQTASAVAHTFSQSCDLVRPGAIAFFQSRSMPLATSTDCQTCLQGSTRHLRDSSGRRLFSNRKIIEQNTTKNLHFETIGPVQQIVHWDLRTSAKLQLQPEGEACNASLLFSYSWYSAALILGFPVDGDPFSAPSNGKMERAYMDGLEKQLEQGSVSRR